VTGSNRASRRMAYSYIPTGLIEAQRPEGMMRFASIDDFAARIWTSVCNAAAIESGRPRRFYCASAVISSYSIRVGILQAYWRWPRSRSNTQELLACGRCAERLGS